jgi:methionyl-tRNA synthetase
MSSTAEVFKETLRKQGEDLKRRYWDDLVQTAGGAASDELNSLYKGFCANVDAQVAAACAKVDEIEALYAATSDTMDQVAAACRAGRLDEAERLTLAFVNAQTT